jgi:adenylate cyclase
MFSKPFQWLSGLPLLLVTGVLAVLAIGALTGAQSPDASGREKLFDYFQRLDPAEGASVDKFHLVLIDRASVDAIGPWPWPRTVIAELVEAAGAAGAKGVILTEAVDAPDPLSPETIGEFWLSGARDETLAQQLALLPRTDERLAEAFTTVDGAVGVAASAPFNPNRASSFLRTDMQGQRWLNTAGSNGDYLSLPATRYFYALSPALANAAQPAVTALAPDDDGVLRRSPLLWSLNGRPAPSVALEAARLASGDAPVVVVPSDAANAQGRTVGRLTVGGETLAVSDSSAVRLYLPKNIAVPSTSASRLLSSASGGRRVAGSNSQLKDKVVLIGLDTELGSPVRTARGDMAPAAVHALAAAQIASGESPLRPGWAGYAEALAVMLLGAAAIMTARRLDFWRAVGFAALISLILTLVAYAAFAFGNVMLNPIPPAMALFIGALSIAGGKSIGGVLRDDNLRGSFHDTLPETAMKRLRENAGAADILTGSRREITVLACELRFADDDLRTMENLPDDITKLLAAASLDLKQTILDAGGAADQAEGGRMFAYFNAPLETADHIQAGCAAALRLIESMDKINADLDASSRTRGLQIHLAIGVATGPCFVGPMGHGRNNRYSAVGPAVDRAAFLRSQSEFYGPAMICDEQVYRETHHHFAFLELDKLKIRGEKRPVSIYALIGNPFIKSSKAFRALDDAHRALLSAYRAGDMATARANLEKAKSSPGAKIALFDIYEERIRKYADEGVPKGWDGAHTAGG